MLRAKAVKVPYYQALTLLMLFCLSGWLIGTEGADESGNLLHNLTLHESYKVDLRQNMQRPTVKNQQLQRFVDNLYIPKEFQNATLLRVCLVAHGLIGTRRYSAERVPCCTLKYFGYR